MLFVAPELGAVIGAAVVCRVTTGCGCGGGGGATGAAVGAVELVAAAAVAGVATEAAAVCGCKVGDGGSTSKLRTLLTVPIVLLRWRAPERTLLLLHGCVARWTSLSTSGVRAAASAAVAGIAFAAINSSFWKSSRRIFS